MKNENIYINGKIKTITIRENKENNTTYYTINGKQLPNQEAWQYLQEFQTYPNFKMEKYTHPNNDKLIIRQFILIE